MKSGQGASSGRHPRVRVDAMCLVSILLLLSATSNAQEPPIFRVLKERPNSSVPSQASQQSSAESNVAPAVFHRESASFDPIARPFPVQTASGTTTVPNNKQVIDPNTLVLNAIQQAVFGPSFSCKVYQQSFAFGQDVILSGDYKSAGNGTGQFRFTSRVSSGETTVDSIQVSDGRLMYTHTAKEPLRIVNIEKIRETLAPRLHQIKESPDIAIHLAIGGQPELLRNLYQRYNWHAVAAGTSDNIEVWQLLGNLRTERPRISGTSQLDELNLATQTSDEGLPPGVRLTIGRSAATPYFPYSIEYFRMKKDKDGRPIVPVAVSHIRYIEPTHNIPINEADFIFRSDSYADTAIREDDLYIPR